MREEKRKGGETRFYLPASERDNLSRNELSGQQYAATCSVSIVSQEQN